MFLFTKQCSKGRKKVRKNPNGKKKKRLSQNSKSPKQERRQKREGVLKPFIRLKELKNQIIRSWEKKES